jgi:hypothetical protein
MDTLVWHEKIPPICLVIYGGATALPLLQHHHFLVLNLKWERGIA